MAAPKTSPVTFNGVAPPWSLASLDANIAAIDSAISTPNNYANYLVDTGVANAYVVTFPNTMTVTLTAGLQIQFKASATNTGASTINPNSLGATAIKKNGSVSLAAMDIVSGTIYTVEYDGTNFQIIAVGNLADLTRVQTFTVAQRGAMIALTDAATIAIDMSASNNFIVQLGGNRTLGAPTGLVSGIVQSGTITPLQDKTGSRTLAYAWPYVWAGGTAGVLSTPGGSEDQLVYEVRSYNSSTVTITIATPGVVTFTAHGFYHGQRCQITTTGALPTGLTASTTYFVEVIDANSFYLCTTLANVAAGTRIATSGSQSGVHTLTGCTIRIALNKAYS